MKPEEWLDLTGRWIEDQESISEEELAMLRSNYQVWSEALEYHGSDVKQEMARESHKTLGGRKVSKETWLWLIGGSDEEPEDHDLTKEEIASIDLIQRRYAERRSAYSNAKAKLRFYKKFDSVFVEEHGEQPAEIQEVFWRQKAENLLKAIEKHRHAHVLANKQPNGLDYELWREADLDEFHASIHAGLQDRGYLTFKEG